MSLLSEMFSFDLVARKSAGNVSFGWKACLRLKMDKLRILKPQSNDDFQGFITFTLSIMLLIFSNKKLWRLVSFFQSYHCLKLWHSFRQVRITQLYGSNFACLIRSFSFHRISLHALSSKQFTEPWKSCNIYCDSNFDMIIWVPIDNYK